MSRRFCHSPNHNSRAEEKLKDGEASLFTCPRCRKKFCSTCEGTTDGLKVCDNCAEWIFRRKHKPVFLQLVKKWAYEKFRKEVIEREYDPW